MPDQRAAARAVFAGRLLSKERGIQEDPATHVRMNVRLSSAPARSVVDALLHEAPEADAHSDPDARRRVERLVDAHFDSIWRFLRRLGLGSGTVDDAAQEVFEVAARRIGDVRVGCEKSFLFATALRVAKASVRKQALGRARHEPFGQEEPRDGDDPEQLLSKRRSLELLDRILSSLDEPNRTAFVLFELEGFTFSEIAELTGVPRGTVASRIRRARAEFSRAASRWCPKPIASRGDHG